jgi:hypothetical protein
MKKITKEQIEIIVNALFDINAPVKLYVNIREMLEKLPDIEESKEVKK